MCVERTQKSTEKINKRQQTIFQLFDRHTKKKLHINADSDFQINDDDERE